MRAPELPRLVSPDPGLLNPQPWLTLSPGNHLVFHQEEHGFKIQGRSASFFHLNAFTANCPPF